MIREITFTLITIFTLFSGLMAAEVETLVYQAFGSDLQSIGGTHNQGSDKSINIYLQNVPYQSLVNNVDCNGFLSQSGQLTFDASKTAATPISNYTSYSYIMIANTGEGRISKIEISGVSGINNPAEVLFGFTSSDPSTLIPTTKIKDQGKYFLDDATLDGPNPTLSFTTTNYKCTSNTIIVPETDDDWISGSGAPIRAVKIAQCPTLGETSFQGAPNANFWLYGIKVYVKTEGTNTGINTAASSNLKLSVANNELNLTEKADVHISSISGYSIQTYKQVENISINNLPSGVYIVKATSNQGETVTTKIIR